MKLLTKEDFSKFQAKLVLETIAIFDEDNSKKNKHNSLIRCTIGYKNNIFFIYCS